MKHHKTLLMVMTVFLAGASMVRADITEQEKQNILAQTAANTMFIQIPGPNPIIPLGPKGSWDEFLVELSDIFKDSNTYYLYYHGSPNREVKSKWSGPLWRIGVATASDPLGPWTKYEGNPILDVEPSWDAAYVACASILKEQGDKYYMWYTGGGSTGLAYASSPLGPWKKYKGNPLIKESSYLGGVVKVKNKYHMYSEYPIGSTSPDEGPIVLATADKPEGPWTKYNDWKPVIPAGDWGAWDDGGFSEAGVLYHDGLFHTFYGGTKWRKFESIGYAFSLDGYNFIKHPGNPIAPREVNPDADAFAEIHTLWEPPFYYVYHTSRYISRIGTEYEDIGVQILATRTPFSLAMPVLLVDSLAAGASSKLKTCSPISLGNISDFALTLECRYHAKAQAGLKVHVLASFDGINYDTEDLYTFDALFTPGQKIRKTFLLNPDVLFVKIIVENIDTKNDIAAIKVTATLGQK